MIVVTKEGKLQSLGMKITQVIRHWIGHSGTFVCVVTIYATICWNMCFQNYSIPDFSKYIWSWYIVFYTSA